MKKIALSLLAAAVMAGGASLGANAAPISGIGGTVALPAAAESLVEKTQFYYGGRDYCWYGGGWRGPGYYWCGYAWRRGYGWGGPVGWRGWGPGYRGGEFRGGRGGYRRH